jgi:hypothetical protein
MQPLFIARPKVKAKADLVADFRRHGSIRKVRRAVSIRDHRRTSAVNLVVIQPIASELMVLSPAN